MLFDRLVDQALSNSNEYSTLRTVVEKEVLHHDILRIMNESGLLKSLVFIGGTCLRNCYGSSRLSEDLDFTGGKDFSGDLFTDLGDVFKKSFYEKYDLPVEIRIPKDNNNLVKTWKLLIQTRPEKHLPAQRIHIDINCMPSYDIIPRMLQNNYGIDLGTSGLIIRAQSRKEILTDKYLALALRPGRIKNRDLWDIGWLYQNTVKPDSDLLLKKLHDYGINPKKYELEMEKRLSSLTENEEALNNFLKEMTRFLPKNIISETVESKEFWTYLVAIILETWGALKESLPNNL